MAGDEGVERRRSGSGARRNQRVQLHRGGGQEVRGWCGTAARRGMLA
jgi:hypothetical protein